MPTTLHRKGTGEAPPAPKRRSRSVAAEAAPPSPETVEVVPRSPEDAMLAVFADVLGDIEKVRVAAENRLRQFTRNITDSDGEMRGFGLDESHPAVARLSGILAVLQDAEDQTTKSLEKAVKDHPLGDWVKKTKGIGLKQGGRLLAAISDPYWHPIENRPRLVSELWSFTGYGVWRIDPRTGEIVPPGQDVPPGDLGIAPHRRKGHKSNWSDGAKMRTFLVAEACLKQLDGHCKQVDGNGKTRAVHLPIPYCGCSPYRRVYDEGRAKYAAAVHKTPCRRCGPSGSPAAAGSPLSDAHKHMRAMRLMSKAILLDLWLEGKRLHEERLEREIHAAADNA